MKSIDGYWKYYEDGSGIARVWIKKTDYNGAEFAGFTAQAFHLSKGFHTIEHLASSIIFTGEYDVVSKKDARKKMKERLEERANLILSQFDEDTDPEVSLNKTKETEL